MFAGWVLGSSSAVAQKHIPEGKYPEVEENHAEDAKLWYENFTNPMGEANYGALQANGFEQMRHMDNTPAMKASSSAAWIEVSKSQDGRVSGRASCIAFDPMNSKTLYLGTITGGLWKSTDFGANWVSLSDGSWKTLVIGGVAVDPTNSKTIYAGTGAPLSDIGGGNNTNGVGVYKSVDGGLNWTLLTNSPQAPISQLEVNAGNPNIIYVAANGVRRSTDGGQTWTTVLALGGTTSLALDPNNPAVLYAAAAGTIKKSIDSGKTWYTTSFQGTGLLTTIAMSKSSSDTIYVSNGTWSQTSILQISTDSGATWQTASQNQNYLGQQPQYANAVAVNPQNPSIIAVGGLDIYTSSRAGIGMQKRTVWTSSNVSSDFTHADIHVLKYDPYVNPPTLFALTDGGVYHSESNGQSWSQNMNATLGTFQFVGGDASIDANNKVAFFAAGAQDNGMSKYTVGSSSYYTSIVGGDGGTTIISADPNANGLSIYGTYVYDVLYHSRDGGNNWPDNPQPINILESTPITQGEHAPFYMEYDVSDYDANIVAVCGNQNLFLSTDGGSTFGNDFPQVTNNGNVGNAISGSVTTVHLAKANPQNIYIGTTSNTMYYSIDQGHTWTRTKTSLNARPTSITSDPSDETHLFMTVAGTGSKHFFISTDTGHTWTAPATNLPALNYRRVAYDGNSGTIFIGNDYGVLRSADGGKNWYPVADGMPLVMVTSLRVRGHYLVAGTYGRGMFYIDINQLPPISSGNNAVNAGAANSGVAISSIYPSVVPSGVAHSNIQFSLADDAHASIEVYDVMGRQERTLANEWIAKGSHDESFDFSGLPAGQHFVRLTADGVSVTKTITIE